MVPSAEDGELGSWMNTPPGVTTAKSCPFSPLLPTGMADANPGPNKHEYKPFTISPPESGYTSESWGQVEGACKHMIGRRLKQTGARWRIRRVNRMAYLCALFHADQWRTYWNCVA